MSRSIIKHMPIKPNQELAFLFDDLPLVGNESSDDYCGLLKAIVADAAPTDAIGWLFLKSVVDATWDIRREYQVKAGIIRLYQKDVVLDLLKTTQDDPTSIEAHKYRIFRATNEADRWAVDASVRKKVDSTLEARGYLPSEVLARACVKASDQIDAVDRRIASLEARRMSILREIERRKDKEFARRLEKSTSEVLDAQFSEAAE